MAERNRGRGGGQPVRLLAESTGIGWHKLTNHANAATLRPWQPR
jgi:hypothetical protein